MPDSSKTTKRKTTVWGGATGVFLLDRKNLSTVKKKPCHWRGGGGFISGARKGGGSCSSTTIPKEQEVRDRKKERRRL